MDTACKLVRVLRSLSSCCKHLQSKFGPGARLTKHLRSALYVVMLAVSIHSCFITPVERLERQSYYDEEIELKQARYTMDPDAGLTKEEKWERNRQIFLNLPKTPNTPGNGFQGMPAMTPRTTAFTQLTGSNAGPSSAGPVSSRPLAFREQFEQYGEVKVPDPI
jgi:hypothetical protein